MRWLGWLMLLVACGSGEAGPNDAGPDAENHCIADFPCKHKWSCVDAAHWVAMSTQPCEVTCHTTNCSGQSCAADSQVQTCPAGTTCLDPSSVPASYAGPPCTDWASLGCEPGDEPSFVPGPTPPAPPRQVGACSDLEVEQFWSRCYDPTTHDDAACSYWTNAYPTCFDCLAYLFTYVSATSNDSGAFLPNVSGCYATLEGSSAPGSCAALEDENLRCAAAACDPSCATSNETFAACVAFAETHECSSFPVCTAKVSPAYDACKAATLADFYVGFGEALCGP